MTPSGRANGEPTRKARFKETTKHCGWLCIDFVAVRITNSSHPRRSGLQPVLGDWNGDGHDEVGLFVNSFWCLDYNGN
jgi:hypothetical protein